MRHAMTMMVAAAGLLGGFEGAARACPEERLVENWYARYLQRPADACGLASWTRELRRSGPECVEAALLASDEYYKLHGCCPAGFVRGLYEDVLGRTPCRDEVRYWTCRLDRCGCRKMVAKEFLCGARRELAGVPAPGYAPAAPLVVVPFAPPPLEPAPGVSLRLRYVRR